MLFNKEQNAAKWPNSWPMFLALRVPTVVQVQILIYLLPK